MSLLGAGPGTCMGLNSLLRLLDRGQWESRVGRGLSTFLQRARCRPGSLQEAQSSRDGWPHAS